MKFLCTKVKPSWLTSSENKDKVTSLGLKIKDPFIGIEINTNEPAEEEKKLIDNAVEKLFSSHKIAFPVRLIDL
ncbi:MAG: hypothetical protein HY094_08680 [Candidatus Melainabacteria bacterium]|nr:hypothetical protein [Candidatus Melainabacteria bacterium]